MKQITTLLWALLALNIATATAQSEHTPGALEALASPQGIHHALLTPRSALPCYPSREQMDAAGVSDNAVVLTAWQVDSLPEGVRYSTRFKRTYRLDDKQIVLRVEGATGAFSVAVNGTEVGYTSAGIGRSEFDLTKRLKENNNTISLTIYRNYAARAIEPTVEGAPHFSRATILTPPRVAVADYVVDTKFNKQGDGLLNLGVVVQSFLLNSKDYTVYYELYSPEGKMVTSANKVVTTGMLSRDTVYFHTRVPQVKRWSPAEPNLYKVVVYTRHENRLKEFTTAEVGFRTVECPEGELVLNGEVQKIVAERLAYEDESTTASALERLKREGCTMVFTARPQPDEFYSLCDRLGMLVCVSADVTAAGESMATTPSNRPEWKEAYMWRAKSAYHSTKLHPSVVMFAIGHDAQNGICLYESYLSMKGLEDESRPMVYPDAAGEWNSDL